MSQNEKLARLRKLLKKVVPKSDDVGESLESGSGGGLTESLDSASGDAFALETLDVLVRSDFESDIDEYQQEALEAIVHERYRPAINVQNNSFQRPSGVWSQLYDDANRSVLENAIPSVGRVEVPKDPGGRPYAGTGFVVGENLLMTNRHVAEIFTNGIGTKQLSFKVGQKDNVAVDFLREHSSNEEDMLQVEHVVMIHPYWDMALLKVKGLAGKKILTLSVEDPAAFEGNHIVTIGYPAFDMRNNTELQNKIFNGIFNVKRLLPGELDSRAIHKSYGHDVNALTHDCSTLGGNSGSAVVHLGSGEVVGLHFAGKYLESNFAVPTFELATDSRVVDAGVNFSKQVAATDNYPSYWRDADQGKETEGSPIDVVDSGSSLQSTVSTGSVVGKPGDGRLHFTLPLHFSVSVADGSLTVDLSPAAKGVTEGMFGGSKPDEQLPLASFFLESLFKDKFSFPAAMSTALASKLAYESAARAKKTIVDGWGFDKVEFITEGSTHCFVATKNKTSVVAFRGTQDIWNWITNVKVLSTNPGYGSVHSGFHSAFGAVKKGIESAIKKSNRVILTGHSLGGALASIGAAEWLGKFPVESIYTFGQPAVGKKKFKSLIQSNYGNSFFRFVNDDDVVPKVPPTYRHVGRLFHLDAKGDLPDTESASETAMFSEQDFEKLQGNLKIAFSGSATESLSSGEFQEGIFPSVRDHAMDEYIRKINLHLV